MIVQIFPHVPEKRKNRKKVDDVKLNLARCGQIRLDFEQIVQIFPDICPGKKKRKT